MSKYKGTSLEKVGFLLSIVIISYFIMHLNGDKEMNLPFYLLKILTKMAKRVQNYPQSSHRSLYHQGFIKILVIYALSELQISWEQILVSLGLQDEDPNTQQPSEQEIEVPQEARVSTEPRSSSKTIHHSKEQTLPTKRRTIYVKGRSITPEKDEIPQRQLRSSTVK
jgi:hypothetical protein